MAQFLVVDENSINAKILRRLLTRCVALAQVDMDGGENTLLSFRSKHYDIIFAEPEMLRMGSAEFLRRIRSLDGTGNKNCPVIAVTAKLSSEDEERYLREGYDGFLNRPVDREQLEEVISRFLPEVTFEPEKLAENEIVLPEVENIDWNLGFSHFPKKEMLYEAILDFYKALELEADTLEGFYRQRGEGNILDQYRIKVHAMKSVANLIGAADLGERARQLEFAAKAGAVEYIENGTESFLAEWRSYKDKLKDCVAVIQGNGAGTQKPKEEISDASVIIAYLEMLRVAMLEMDIDGVDSVMEKLEGFRYLEELERSIDKLSVYVTNMDCEQTVSLIEEMMDKIE